MAKIDSIEDLAEWFDIKNYLSANRLKTMQDWYRHLAPRKYLLDLLRIREENPELAQDVSDVFARDIKNMRGCAVEDAHIPNFFGPMGFDYHLAERRRGVRSLTSAQLSKQATKISTLYEDPKKWFTTNKKISENLNNRPGVDLLSALFRYRTGADRSSALVQFDMDLPDALLLKGFATELPAIRAYLCNVPDKKNYHRPKIQNWARYGLLPYLDLLIWELETGASISPEVMAFAIKSGYVADKKQLLDTVIPLATRLMNGDLEELLVIIAIDANKPPTTIRKK